VPEDLDGGHAPVIIKRVSKRHRPHHGGMWKVAYADLVTAMMAFFIVLWILGSGDEVVANVAAYFKDPIGFSEGGVADPLESGTNSGETAIFEDRQRNQMLLDESEKARRLEEYWRDQAERIRESLSGIESLSKYRDQIEISLTPEGLKISLIEDKDTPLFQLGGIELQRDAVTLLQELGKELSRLPNYVVVEGHTDGVSFGASSVQSNWELSTGRSNTARRAFEVGGIHESRFLEVRGYSDRMPYNPLDPQDSRNRRVSITLLTDDAYRIRQEMNRQQVIP
jgi:chemotaxis protein MotB